jgi:hypothetical protein
MWEREIILCYWHKSCLIQDYPWTDMYLDRMVNERISFYRQHGDFILWTTCLFYTIDYMVILYYSLHCDYSEDGYKEMKLG